MRSPHVSTLVLFRFGMGMSGTLLATPPDFGIYLLREPASAAAV